jgi:hypothetical protein
MDRAGFYRGTVVSNTDPSGLGLVRADVPQILGSSTMGGCRPMMGAVNGIPAVGELIWVSFEGGDVNYPLYIRSNTLSLDSLTDGTIVDNTALDTRTPAAPDLIPADITSVAYNDSLGALKGRVTFTWGAVTGALDGTAMSIGGYEAWGMQLLDAAGVPVVSTWSQITSSDTLTATWGPFDVGTSWAFMIRARATNSPTLGAFSVSVTHTVSTSIPSPDVPSTPAISSKLGNVYVTWNGRNYLGAEMPVTFDHIEVRLGSTSATVTDSSYPVDPLLGAGHYLAPLYGTLQQAGTVSATFSATTVYAWIRAVDVLGTASAWTPVATVSLVSVYADPSIQTNLATPLGVVQGQVATINGAVQIVQGASPSITITNGATSPTKVQITPSEMDFYNSGAIVAYINSDVSGGKMYANAMQVNHHLIQWYDANTTVVRWAQ